MKGADDLDKVDFFLVYIYLLDLHYAYHLVSSR